eukprot:scaffold220078_cov30-Prasinocladus_malaysianus.AAC.1
MFPIVTRLRSGHVTRRRQLNENATATCSSPKSELLEFLSAALPSSGFLSCRGMLLHSICLPGRDNV